MPEVCSFVVLSKKQSKNGENREESWGDGEQPLSMDPGARSQQVSLQIVCLFLAGKTI